MSKTTTFHKKIIHFIVVSDDEIDKESFLVALRTRPILFLNLFILAFNWFVCCHNLYGLVLVKKPFKFIISS
jgi:hypothetical protein